MDNDTEVRLEVRIAPAAVSTLGPVGRTAARLAGRATHGETPRVVTTFARHRRLFRRWLPFSTGLLRGTDLPRPDVELLILRTAWNCASWYEWAQHVSLATEAGLDAAAAVRVTEGAGADGWSPRQRLLLLAADELHERRVITDRTWAALVGEFTENELLELCFVVGHYEMVAMTLNSLGVEPEPSALDRLDTGAAAAATTLAQTLATRRRSDVAGQ